MVMMHEAEALPTEEAETQDNTKETAIQSRIGAARESRSSSGGRGVQAPALEVGRERGGLEDAARQERQLWGELAPGAGAHVVEALDDERRLLGDGALELGVEPVVARGGDPRPQGVALGGIGLVHDGGVPALEGAMLRVLDEGVPVVAQLVVCVLWGVGGGDVGQHVPVLV